MTQQRAIKIFLLNAPEDHEFLKELRNQLKILEKKGIIDNWDDTEIRGGMVINDTIEANLKAAEVFVPLVSADYLASDKCQEIQKKAVAMGKKILPVIVRDCLWEWDDDLNPHPAFPQKENGETSPVSHWSKRGSAYTSIARGIHNMLKPMLAEQKKSKSMLPHQSFDNGYALLIGVGNDLPITVKDANAVGNLLQNQAAYPSAQVQTVTEKAASRDGILQAFDHLIAQTSKNPKATVVVYYSGHGGFVDLPNGKKQYFLVPNNFNQDDIDGTAITSEEFSAKINAIRSQKLVVLLDCCHAAGIPKNILKKFDFTKAAETLVEQLDKGSGRVVMASSKDNELSWIYPNESYSTFTNSLVEALMGKAHHRNDGYVRILNVLDYVMEKVKKRTDGKQNPYIKRIEDLSDNFAICALRTSSDGNNEESDSNTTNGNQNDSKESSNNKPNITMDSNRRDKEIARLEKRIQNKQKLVDRYHDTIDRLDDSIGSMNVLTDILDINKLEKQKELVEEQLMKVEEDIAELEDKLKQLKSNTSPKYQSNSAQNKSENIEKAKTQPKLEPINTVSEIKVAIASGQLEEAIEAMLKMSEGKDDELYTQIILQSARYNKITKDSTRYNTVSAERSDITYSQIRYALLQILKDLEEL